MRSIRICNSATAKRMDRDTRDQQHPPFANHTASPLQVAAPEVVNPRAISFLQRNGRQPNTLTMSQLENIPVFHDPGQVREVQSQYEYLPHGLVDAAPAQPMMQHLTLSASLGHAPVLYTPPLSLHVDVLMQMPWSPHSSVALLPVQRPLRVAVAVKGRRRRVRRCILGMLVEGGLMGSSSVGEGDGL